MLNRVILQFLLMAIFSCSTFSTANANKDGEELWANAQRLLNDNLLQEAIWLLGEAGFHDEANYHKARLEYILTYGEVTSKHGGKKLGGATGARLIELEEGIKAVFKAKTIKPSSSHTSEAGAYRFDELFGLHLVPMTVIRKIDGKIGSLQYFINNASSAGKLLNYQKSARLNIFDYLIKNRDRHEDNILIIQGREVAIDHGLSLRSVNPVGRYLRVVDAFRHKTGSKKCVLRQKHDHPTKHIKNFIPDTDLDKSLNTITSDDIERILKPYVSSSQITAVIKRFNKLHRLLQHI